MKTITIPEINFEKYIEAFKTLDTDYIDSVHDTERKTYEKVFRSIKNNEFDIAYYEKNENIYTLTRCTSDESKLQLSVFWNRNNELILLSDQKYSSIKEMDRKNAFHSGITIILQ